MERQAENTPLPRLGTPDDVGGLLDGVESVAAYDPWTDEWTDLDGAERVHPPAFERSLVIRLEH